MNRPNRTHAVLAAALLFAGAASAQEAAIRKALIERLPNLKIDEVRPAPMPGLYEVRYGGTEIVYTDAKGEYLLQGSLVETKTMANLTEERIDKLTAVEFSTLPVKDAMTFKQGNGTRKLAVFVDPNCGYCKRFERDLVNLKDVTIHTFIMPILGPDSNAKARDIWCSKDAAKSWRAWMIDGVAPPRQMGTGCDAGALDRNLDFARKARINGTPAIFFEDGTRKPGALSGDAVEKLLAAAAAKKPS
jgi:thiol:disulfide interchange protein DsbC